MSPLRGRRAGMAILRIEREEISPDRMLIRVRTVADVAGTPAPEEHVFSATEPALEYLRGWLEAWSRHR